MKNTIQALFFFSIVFVFCSRAYSQVPVFDIKTEKDVVKTGETETEKAEKNCQKRIFGSDNKQEIIFINNTMKKFEISVIEYKNYKYETGSYKTEDSATVGYFIKKNPADKKDDVVANTNQLVSIFPNPFTQSATLYLNFNLTEHKNIYAVIYNSMGKEVKRINNITSNTTTIVATDLEKGTYVYKVVSDNGLSENGKFIIN